MISQARTKRVLSVIIYSIVSLILAVGFVILPARAAEPSPTIEELQQWVRDQGYNYTVAENWITQLSPEEREALCGLRQLEAPTEPVSGNIRFFSHVPEAETGGLGIPPPTYDAMALGYVTPVKAQGGCGSCWAHAACADLESDVAIWEATHLDFSEQEVIDCNIWSSVGGYDSCPPGTGGNAYMTTNYLTKYGAADETCHPYAATQQTCWACPLQRSVNNWRMVTDSGGDSLSQVPTIKNAILNYGPVYSTMYASGPGFSSYYSGVYEYWGSEVPNHAIQIIGWDDSLTHTHGSGAWLIKNSWGTTWGAGVLYPGCGWVAYGAANLGDYTSAICGYRTPGNTIYYHDECGWMGYSWGYGSPTGYGAVRFTPSQDSILTAVDFWAVDTSMNYEIKIFDTRTGGPVNWVFSIQLGTTQTGTTSEQGYYSLPLDTPVPLTGGDDFIVQVKFTTSTPGHNFPIPIDYCTVGWLPSWSGIATFSGESYSSGTGTQFAKPYDPGVGEYFDVGIRARTELPDLVVAKSVEFSGGNFTVSYNVTNIGNATAGNSTTCKFFNSTLEESQPCPALGPGESYNGTFAPEPCPCGQVFNVTVCADNDDVVAESNETNNCEINILECPPDLVITEKSEEWVDLEAKTYNITYTVANQGCSAAGASNTTITINSIDVLEDPVPALAAGANYSNTVGPFTMSGNSANITVCADNDNVVAESDEDNNCQMNTLECPTPDISVSPASFNKTLLSDTTQDYTLTISNDGDGDLSYNISDGECPWLSESPTSGTVEPGGSHNITVSINTTGLGSNYTAEIVIANNDPDEDPKIVPVTLHVRSSHNITLSTGWNLVSLPVIPDNTSIVDVTAAINTTVSIIWYYNANTATWLWYVPGNPASTLSTIEDGKGYWFLMNSPAALEGSGWEMPGPGAPPTYDVFVGWNLIGFSSTTSMSPESYLATIAGTYNPIYGWDAEGQTWLWYVPGNLSSTLTTMEPGYGYWLLATADGTIVPPA